jgi:hypothetical protein
VSFRASTNAFHPVNGIRELRKVVVLIFLLFLPSFKNKKRMNTKTCGGKVSERLRFVAIIPQIWI